MIKTVNIIGAGNVGSFLANKLGASIIINSIFSRNIEKARKIAKDVGATGIDSLDKIPNTNLNIVAVPDDGIEETIKFLNKKTPIVHTSGSLTIDVFNGFENYGIFYPLQTFTEGRVVESNNIPFLIEASSVEFELELIDFAKTYFTNKVTVANSEKRERIHLAAVFVNNFPTLLFTEAKELLGEVNEDLSLLHPLMIETIKKTIEMGPQSSQTGPAIRNDQKTINKHLSKLSDQDLKSLYELMSKLIQKRHPNI